MMVNVGQIWPRAHAFIVPFSITTRQKSSSQCASHIHTLYCLRCLLQRSVAAAGRIQHTVDADQVSKGSKRLLCFYDVHLLLLTCRHAVCAWTRPSWKAFDACVSATSAAQPTVLGACFKIQLLISPEWRIYIEILLDHRLTGCEFLHCFPSLRVSCRFTDLQWNRLWRIALEFFLFIKS